MPILCTLTTQMSAPASIAQVGRASWNGRCAPHASSTISGLPWLWQMSAMAFRSVQVPYGVVECDGALVRALREKPVRTFLVNAGIYLLEPSVMRYIPEGRRFDMTDLIQSLLDAGRRVASFPIVEYWLDIGRMADYEQAQDDVKHARL